MTFKRFPWSQPRARTRRCHLPRPGAGAARTGRFPPSLEGFAAGARHCLHLLTGHGRAEACHGGRWPAMGCVVGAVCRCGPQAWPVPVTSVLVPARLAASTAPPAGAGCSATCTTPPLFSRRTWPCRRGALRPCTGSRVSRPGEAPPVAVSVTGSHRVPGAARPSVRPGSSIKSGTGRPVMAVRPRPWPSAPPSPLASSLAHRSATPRHRRNSQRHRCGRIPAAVSWPA